VRSPVAIATAMVPHPMKPMVRPSEWSVEVEADMGNEVVVDEDEVTGEIIVLLLDFVDAAVTVVVGVSNG